MRKKGGGKKRGKGRKGVTMGNAEGSQDGPRPRAQTSPREVGVSSGQDTTVWPERGRAAVNMVDASSKSNHTPVTMAIARSDGPEKGPRKKRAPRRSIPRAAGSHPWRSTLERAAKADWVGSENPEKTPMLERRYDDARPPRPSRPSRVAPHGKFAPAGARQIDPKISCAGIEQNRSRRGRRLRTTTCDASVAK